jgi:sugar phosphate isomerase/epimerase
MRDLAAHPELLSLNTATVRERWTLPEIIEGCARHGIRAISPWRDQVAACGLETAAMLIRTHTLKLSGYCRGGMFPVADAAARRRARDDNLRALDEAVALGAACLILVVGGLPPGSKDIAGARRQVEDGIAWLAEQARPAGMKLAIEPLHPMYAADRACVNTLAQANDICERLGDGVGVAVDVYHVWWDPALEREIARAGHAQRLYAFHVCDWLVPTADLLLDRGMMGDGVIDIPRIRGWVEAAGYDGYVETEIFSAANWWKRDPDEVLEVVKERYKTVC